jgi:hypothetical protein
LARERRARIRLEAGHPDLLASLATATAAASSSPACQQHLTPSCSLFNYMLCICWVQGGPGCSSLFGLFYINGPFQLQTDMTLRDNPGKWNRQYGTLFLDQPIGTGFSIAGGQCSSSCRQTSSGTQAEAPELVAGTQTQEGALSQHLTPY